MIKLRFYRPIAPSRDTPKKYWMYSICLGCTSKLSGLGIEINGQPFHLNINCIIKGIKLERELKMRNY